LESDPRVWIATLRRSHDRLAELVALLTPEQLRSQSYCTDWSVAQVLSHLGSGAEMALLGLPGALGEGEPLSGDARGPIWDKWNAKAPDDQAADALAIDEQQVTFPVSEPGRQPSAASTRSAASLAHPHDSVTPAPPCP
jgi:uncharacterized protein (TIGR03083 family)